MHVLCRRPSAFRRAMPENKRRICLICKDTSVEAHQAFAQDRARHNKRENEKSERKPARAYLGEPTNNLGEALALTYAINLPSRCPSWMSCEGRLGQTVWPRKSMSARRTSTAERQIQPEHHASQPDAYHVLPLLPTHSRASCGPSRWHAPHQAVLSATLRRGRRCPEVGHRAERSFNATLLLQQM